MVKRWLKHFAGMIIIGVSIAACSSSVPPKQEKVCEALTQQYKMANILRRDGVQVIQVGDENTLILSADDFFYGRSNHLHPSMDSTLNKIIDFINTYPSVNIRVTGYTDSYGDYTRNLALSRAQAQAVAHYLWHHGLNTRLISARGEGCHYCVASNTTIYGRSQNRRVEIYFRLPPPNNVFH